MILFVFLTLFHHGFVQAATLFPGNPVGGFPFNLSCEGPCDINYPDVINIPDFGPIVIPPKIYIYDITHAYPDDINIVLQSPSGTLISLLTDTGGEDPCVNMSLIIDSRANVTMQDNGPMVSGTYIPSNVHGAIPIPVLATYPVSRSLEVLIGEPTLGDWSLYVYDDHQYDCGYIDNWAIEFEGASPTPSITGSTTPSSTQTGTMTGTGTQSITVSTTLAPTQTPAPSESVSVTAIASQSVSISATFTETRTQTPTRTSSVSPTPTSSSTKTPTRTPTGTPSPTKLPEPSESVSASELGAMPSEVADTPSPSPTSTLHCGDGIVQRDEECDFVSTPLCCDNFCKLRPIGMVCKRRTNDCYYRPRCNLSGECISQYRPLGVQCKRRRGVGTCAHFQGVADVEKAYHCRQLKR